MQTVQHPGETLVAAVRYCLSNPSYVSYGVTQDVERNWDEIPQPFRTIIANEIAAALDSWKESKYTFDTVSWCRILARHVEPKRSATSLTDIDKVKG